MTKLEASEAALAQAMPLDLGYNDRYVAALQNLGFELRDIPANTPMGLDMQLPETMLLAPMPYNLGNRYQYPSIIEPRE